MARNLSQIVEAVENLNVSFQEISVENIVPVAISNANETTNGWIGIVVLSIFCLSVLLFLLRNKSSFNIFNSFSLILIFLSISIDLSIQLLMFGILDNLQLFMFIYVTYFVVCVISFLRKELLSVDT